jgi:hypothetical protein
MNKDFGLILSLATTVGAQMPATRAAFQVNAALCAQGGEQDFSAVIPEMEKQAQLGSQGTAGVTDRRSGSDFVALQWG